MWTIAVGFMHERLSSVFGFCSVLKAEQDGEEGLLFVSAASVQAMFAAANRVRKTSSLQ